MQTDTQTLDTSFFARLERETEAAPGRRKRDRTHARIRLATAQCLERSGYLDFKTIDITEQAGLSEGSFYVYFKDKRQAALSVLREFLAVGVGSTTTRERRATPSAFEAIRSTNRLWIRTAIEHPGLTRSVFQLVDLDPEFAAIYADYNKQWHEAVTKSVLKRYPPHFHDSEQGLLFAIVALGAMMDEVVRGIFVTKTHAHLLELVDKDKTGESLADALTVMWFRILYPGAELPRDRRKQPFLMSDLDGSQAETGTATD